MKFKDWVFNTQGGVVPLAYKLGIDPMTIKQWFRRKSHPKIFTMQRLVKMGKGKFSYEDVIRETGPKNKGGKK